MKKLITREVMKPSIFGMFDGLTSLLGVLIPLLKYTHLLVFTTCVGLAVSSAISMGLGEYLSYDKDISTKTRIHTSIYMGIFTAIGCFLPVVPFLFVGGVIALVSSIIIYLLLTLVVAFMKSGDLGWRSALVQTLSISLVAVALVICATLLLPAPSA
jgi:VIT1/CCC1 family predicted Fe2+/Mn2+ transporter